MYLSDNIYQAEMQKLYSPYLIVSPQLIRMCNELETPLQVIAIVLSNLSI